MGDYIPVKEEKIKRESLQKKAVRFILIKENPFSFNELLKQAFDEAGFLF